MLLVTDKFRDCIHIGLDSSFTVQLTHLKAGAQKWIVLGPENNNYY